MSSEDPKPDSPAPKEATGEETPKPLLDPTKVRPEFLIRLDIWMLFNRPTRKQNNSSSRSMASRKLHLGLLKERSLHQYVATTTMKTLISLMPSLQGGKQYFDSGDYNKSANRKDRQAIASHPHAMNPHLAQMRAKAVVHKTQPSKLASGTAKSPLAS